MKILYCEGPFQATSTSAPLVTLLTDSSLSRNNWPLFLPPHHQEWIMSFAPAFRVSRLGKFIATRFAQRYYDAMSIIARLRPASQQLPDSAVNTAFDSSAVVGAWIPLPGVEEFELRLSVNGVDSSHNLQLSSVNDTVSTLSRYFMIKHGDIITDGDLPLDATNIKPGMSIDVSLNEKKCLNFKIK